MKKIYFTIIILTLFACSSYSQVLFNNYLSVYGEKSTGRIYIKTTQGSLKVKGDENKNITKSSTIPFTSFISVAIDGKIYVINSESEFTKRIQEDGNKLICSVKLPDNIILQQIVSIYTIPETNKKNAIKIEFRIKNNDEKAHNIRLRYVLDTDLETTGNFAFSTSNGKNIRRETEFKKYIPSHLNIINDFNSPVLRCFIKTRIPGSIKPYKILLAAYNKFVASKFEFKSKKGASFAAGSRKLDAAMGFYYNFGRMIPAKEYNAVLIVGVTDKIIRVKTGYVIKTEIPDARQYPPLRIKVKVKNTGKTKFRIVKAILSYPRFMRNSRIINSIQTKTNLRKGRSHTFYWNLTYDKNIKAMADIKIYIKIYYQSMRLKTRTIIKKVYLSGGKKVEKVSEKLTRGKVNTLLKQILLSRETQSQVLNELNQIDYIIYTIRKSANMDAYIAGQRIITKDLFNKIKKQVAKLIYYARKRRSKKAGSSQLYHN